MKVAFDIQITDESLKMAGLTYYEILDKSLCALANLYDTYNLDSDVGYNPQMVTSGKRN